MCPILSQEVPPILLFLIYLKIHSEENHSRSIYFDGTFKTVPQIFSQLFTAHATNFATTVPCVYALMQRKKGSI
ncbi:hypothetical protein HZS_6085 [Henneguya salminicola]|nr:hypothetical protein HZS_6085 [Henneguya salminicola]